VNDVTVTPLADGVRLHDGGASLATTSPHCRAVDPQTVECEPSIVVVHTEDRDDRVAGERLRAFLGPGDDRAEVDGGASGGDGNDVLAGKGAGSWLDGGAGDDVLRGTPGRDVLEAGPGSDVVEAGADEDTIGLADAPGPPAPDRADAGPNRDRLHYRTTDAAIEVDLGAGRTGAGATGDVLAGFEALEGGGGRDVLVGDGLPNVIDGGPHHDVVTGQAGDDQLIGGDGNDAIDGGDGDDSIDAELGIDVVRAGAGADRIAKSGAGGSVDAGAGDDRIEISRWHFRPARLRVACGPGRDTSGVSRRPSLAPDCERLRFGAVYDRVTVQPPLRLRRTTVRVRLRGQRGTNGVLVLRDRRGRLLGTGVWRGRGVDLVVTVRLEPRAARRARRTGALRATIEDVERNRDGSEERSVRVPVTIRRG
jgi:hypothetical protein